MPRIERWTVWGRRICGHIYGDPMRPDGRDITTSPIVRWANNRVLTQSGSEYELGDPAGNSGIERLREAVG